MPDIDREVAGLVMAVQSQLLIHDEFEARYWSRVLGVPRSQLRNCLEMCPVPPSELPISKE